MRRSISLFFLAALSLSGHSISVSTSEGKITGSTVQLELKIPRYEAEDILKAGADAGLSVRFPGTKLTQKSCSMVGEEYRCQLAFASSTEIPEKVRVEVDLARLTVPNHIHILRLERSGVARQGIFDRTFESDQIDFHETGKGEQYWRTVRQGALQLGLQPLLLLLLVTIGLCFRPTWYVVGGLAAFLVVLPDKFYATPAFFELATALGVSYLAMEQWWFPNAGARWAPALVIGAMEGAGLAVMARPSGEMAVSYGLANLAAQALVSLLVWRFTRTYRSRISSPVWATILATGVIWTIWVFVKRF